MNRPGNKSGRADCASYRRPRPGQRLDQLVEEASNEKTKVGGEGLVGGGEPANAWRCGARRRRRSKPEGKAGWEGSERREKWEGGVEDRKEETVERMEEQRAVYTRAKPRGGRQPRWGGAKPETAAHRHLDYEPSTMRPTTKAWATFYPETTVRMT
jgi:hypothetical protein